ncbi:hypothetical protein F8388_004611 [Cannabis sativa]|uniref:peptidylprolyl isomerase n=1 Tax=Cannabis sativa TaxID=3483 RepID=A0A7J6GNN3_CANSA|nr:hypothetical protein F8388_004611 [Cannabis sativa]
MCFADLRLEMNLPQHPATTTSPKARKSDSRFLLWYIRHENRLAPKKSPLVLRMIVLVIEKPCQEPNINSLGTPLVHYPKPKNYSRVLKKTLKEGEGYERPNDGTLVQVKLTGKLHDGIVFTRKGHDDGKPYEFKINEEQVIDGLDRAVKNMKKGEVALVTIHPEYAFGSSDSSQDLAVVPANSVVYYEVELVSFVKGKESWDMNTQEKIEAAGKKKEEGNALFKAGKYERASKRYEKAVGFVEYDSSFSDEEKQQAKVLKITCNLNNAACKLKLKDYKQAGTLFTKVLDLDSKNVKALYRRAQAYIQLVDLDSAEIDIKKALEIEPDNRDVKMEYKLLKEKVREYNKKDAQFYNNIFAKMNKFEQVKSNGKEEAVSMTIDSKA